MKVTSASTFFEKITPSRRRIHAEETAKGFRFNATAEGDDYTVTVSEHDEKDIAKVVKTTLGAELASMIIETRKEFVDKKIALAIPNMVKFIESQSSVLSSAVSAKKSLPKTGGILPQKIDVSAYVKRGLNKK